MSNKIKLLSHQIDYIHSFIEKTYPELEDKLLDAYKAYDISDLNATDFDDIMDNLAEWYSEINNKHKG